LVANQLRGMGEDSGKPPSRHECRG